MEEDEGPKLLPGLTKGKGPKRLPFLDPGSLSPKPGRAGTPPVVVAKLVPKGKSPLRSPSDSSEDEEENDMDIVVGTKSTLPPILLSKSLAVRTLPYFSGVKSATKALFPLKFNQVYSSFTNQDRELFPSGLTSDDMYRTEVKDLIQKMEFCKTNIDDIGINVVNLNVNILTETILNHYHDPEAAKAAVCLVNKEIHDSIYGTWRIRRLIRRIMQIGEDSSYGVALSASITDERGTGDSAFVIKASKEKHHSNDIVHEVAIGLTVANEIRNLGIPNFSYVFGGFHCSMPVNVSRRGTDKDGFCDTFSKDSVPYVMYENIQGRSLDSIYPGLSIADATSVLVQLFLALELANRRYGFTHYDFHAKNVMVRKLTSPSVLRYELRPDQVLYVEASYMPVIIDYGFSRAYVPAPGETENTIPIGKTGMERSGISPTNSYPLCDISKLISYLKIKAEHRYKKSGKHEPSDILIGKIYESLFDETYSYNETAGVESTGYWRDPKTYRGPLNNITNIKVISDIFKVKHYTIPYIRSLKETDYLLAVDVIIDVARKYVNVNNIIRLNDNSLDRRVLVCGNFNVGNPRCRSFDLYMEAYKKQVGDIDYPRNFVEFDIFERGGGVSVTKPDFTVAFVIEEQRKIVANYLTVLEDNIPKDIIDIGKNISVHKKREIDYLLGVARAIEAIYEIISFMKGGQSYVNYVQENLDTIENEDQKLEALIVQNAITTEIVNIGNTIRHYARRLVDLSLDIEVKYRDYYGRHKSRPDVGPFRIFYNVYMMTYYAKTELTTI